MQPRRLQEEDIKNLTDFVYKQFGPVDSVRVKNILKRPFAFDYCTNDEILTPDQYTKKVVDRQYQRFEFAPGEVKTLMGGAAYLGVENLARDYVTLSGGDAGDMRALTEAARKAIVEVLGRPGEDEPAPGAADEGSADNPVEPKEPAQTTPKAEEEAFGHLAGSDPAAPFKLGESTYSVVPQANGGAKYKKDNAYISKSDYEAAKVAFENKGSFRTSE